MKTTFESAPGCALPKVGEEYNGGVVTAVSGDPNSGVGYVEVESSSPIPGTTLGVVKETSYGLLVKNGDEFFVATSCGECRSCGAKALMSREWTASPSVGWSTECAVCGKTASGGYSL